MKKSFNSKFLHHYSWLMNIVIVLVMVVAYIWALQGLKVDSALLKDSWPYIIDFISRLFPPDWKVVDIAIKGLIETVQMSLWGTSLGAIISLPIAIASANNIAPLWLRWLANLLQNAVRSVPSIILGLIFVAATGLGAPAGTLALSIYTIGYLAKFYQQAIEAVDARSLESLQVIGASRIQVVQYGIIPQVLPLGLGYTLWMFEYNIRAASVLGVVGAGGIGFQLKSYIDGFEYNKATTMMLVLLVVVTVIDVISSKLRRYLDSM
ncbi:phosphonate ABC transporter, permease protein PhnE [Sphaerospermopsis sp. FACHB-1094]|uniref:phosphonate ABC transporter, permease protein PhnE n=1 Tax=Sphaerospermopsis sp. FACHB-1094 TaxID=2692861 RepID=UPI001689EC2F|nr:phosphonate ABC transporter, permease protein PhnE [Sphaerospermopsis sp. FACHB-1094]MBD2132388.1 phosphonate ABC transporter, permease protein PhnE [Sphaerospermopsis sp. FACHB-1094]